MTSMPFECFDPENSNIGSTVFGTILSVVEVDQPSNWLGWTSSGTFKTAYSEIILAHFRLFLGHPEWFFQGQNRRVALLLS